MNVYTDQEFKICQESNEGAISVISTPPFCHYVPPDTNSEFMKKMNDEYEVILAGCQKIREGTIEPYMAAVYTNRAIVRKRMS